MVRIGGNMSLGSGSGVLPVFNGTVKEIKSRAAEAARSSRRRPIDLGDEERSSQVNGLLSRMQQNSGRVFVVSWEGSKIPRGAEILGHRIGWTQHGVVTAEDGTRMGTYERTKEFAGASGKEQEIIVYLSPTLSETRT